MRLSTTPQLTQLPKFNRFEWQNCDKTDNSHQKHQTARKSQCTTIKPLPIDWAHVWCSVFRNFTKIKSIPNVNVQGNCLMPTVYCCYASLLIGFQSKRNAKTFPLYLRLRTIKKWRNNTSFLYHGVGKLLTQVCGARLQLWNYWINLR